MILNKNTISSKLDSPNLKDNDIKTKQSFKEGKAKCIDYYIKSWKMIKTFLMPFNYIKNWRKKDKCKFT